ncbi:MAG: hypothetical protein N2578_04960 [Bdellovibrionaceae bacterium]|nr:hypothetical protein [Pseudobdellovibrionaceae bacterium]
MAKKTAGSNKQPQGVKPAKASKSAQTRRKSAGKEKEVLELDDALLDEAGGSDLSEYEEELRAVEAPEKEEAAETSTPRSDLLSVSVNEEEPLLTDAEGNRYCRARDCDQIARVEAWCRYHYLLFWRRIQNKKKIIADGKLQRYIDELTSRYPDKFLEMIRRDLRTEKDFMAVIAELEIDESSLDNDFEEDAQSYLDEVRGFGESGGLEEDESF